MSTELHSSIRLDRTMIFIDAANFYAALKKMAKEADYLKFVEAIFPVDKGELKSVRIYVPVDPESEGKKKFLYFLRKSGFRVIEKDIKILPEGEIKANMDVEITCDMMQLVNQYDTVILVSGDEDFSYALDMLMRLGKRVIVASFKDSLAKRLLEHADQVIELDDLLPRFEKKEKS